LLLSFFTLLLGSEGLETLQSLKPSLSFSFHLKPLALTQNLHFHFRYSLRKDGERIKGNLLPKNGVKLGSMILQGVLLNITIYFPGATQVSQFILFTLHIP